jgi:hypothetical protein
MLKSPEMKKWREKLAYTEWVRSHSAPVQYTPKTKVKTLHSTAFAFSVQRSPVKSMRK